MEEGPFLGDELADETLFRLDIEIPGQDCGVGHLSAVEAPGKERPNARGAFQSCSNAPDGAGDERAMQPQSDQAVERMTGIDLSGAGEYCGEHPGDGEGSMWQFRRDGQNGGQAFAGCMV